MKEEVAPPFSDQLELADEDEDEINGDTTDELGIDDTEAPPMDDNFEDLEVKDDEQSSPDDNFEDLEVGFEDDEQSPAEPLMQMNKTAAMRNFQRALMSRF